MVWTRAAPWAPPGRPARNTASRHRRPAVRSGIATAATGVARRLTCWGCRNGGCFSGWDVNVPSKRAFPRSRRGPPGPLRQQVFVQAGPARGPPAAAGADASGYRQCPPGPGAAAVSAPVWAAAAALYNPGAALAGVQRRPGAHRLTGDWPMRWFWRWSALRHGRHRRPWRVPLLGLWSRGRSRVPAGPSTASRRRG